MVTPRSFSAHQLSARSLEKVSGKGAKLARAGFNLLQGFLIPTETYKQFISGKFLVCPGTVPA